MSGAWKLEEARLVQIREGSSAANANEFSYSAWAVPAGKCWVILACGYVPSVAETQVISFEKVDGAGKIYGLLNPISLNLNPARATFIEQGMEYMLLPGEYLRVRRVDHTAGSTMNLSFSFIEIDLPLYTYDEPQVVKRQDRALSSLRQRLGGGGGSFTSPPRAADRGGRSGPLEK